MYILHIETSTRICSVALSRDREVLAWEDHAEDPNHAALLPLAIGRLLEKSGITPKDLGAVSVCSGPGSYTGLRIGSSTAKAMAYTLGIPLVGVPTLYALAHAALEKFPEAVFALPMLDARRKEVYTALYDRNMTELLPVSALILDTPASLAWLEPYSKVVVCGDGSPKLVEICPPGLSIISDTDLLCSARHLVGPAAERIEKGLVEDPL